MRRIIDHHPIFFLRLQIFSHGVLNFLILSRRLRMKRKTWKRRRTLKGKRRVGRRIIDHQPIFSHGCRFFLTVCLIFPYYLGG